MLKANIDAAVAAKANKPAEFERVIVATLCRKRQSHTLLEIVRHKALVGHSEFAGVGDASAVATPLQKHDGQELPWLQAHVILMRIPISKLVLRKGLYVDRPITQVLFPDEAGTP